MAPFARRRCPARRGKPRRGQTLHGERRHQLADPDPGVGGVLVARVLDPGNPARRERRLQAGLGHTQERPDKARPRQLDHRRHGGEPVQAAAPAETQEQGLGLIVEVMGERQVQHALGLAPPGEQLIASPARHGLDIGRGFGPSPAQHLMADSQRPQRPPHVPGFGRRFRTQAVIDGERGDGAPGGARPIVQQDRKRHTVGPAGDRDR